METSPVSADNQGIQNYSKMNDKDKAYVVKLGATLISAVIAGIITGTNYSGSGGTAGIGFGIFFAVTLGMSLFIKQKFDLSEMSDQQILRHGIAIGFITYIFLWTVVFQFVLF